MDPAIITALIVAVGSSITQVIIATAGKRSTEKIINFRLDALTEKVDKHNHLVERMAKAETDIENIKSIACK